MSRNWLEVLTMAEKYEILPVPTRILTVHDNIVDAIKEFGGSMIGPRDVVCVAESVVAITQNRAIRPETLKIGFAAKVFSQLFPGYGSISNWSAMQSLINEEGTLRITFAVVAGFFMKLIGKAGWFYRLGGEQARLVDDITGTMPPYDKHIVLGPKHASSSVPAFWAQPKASIPGLWKRSSSTTPSATPARRLLSASSRTSSANG